MAKLPKDIEVKTIKVKKLFPVEEGSKRPFAIIGGDEAYYKTWDTMDMLSELREGDSAELAVERQSDYQGRTQYLINQIINVTHAPTEATSSDARLGDGRLGAGDPGSAAASLSSGPVIGEQEFRARGEKTERGNELAATSEVEGIVMLPMSTNQILANFRQIQELKARLITAKDKITIQGKPYILKSGWRTLAFAFNLSDEVVYHEKEEKDGVITWRIHTRVTAPNGRSVVGVAACSSNERRFTHPAHDVYAMASTRSKNRAISDILGLGEVSAEEMTAEVDPD
jgi:hypothetical protein